MAVPARPNHTGLTVGPAPAQPAPILTARSPWVRLRSRRFTLSMGLVGSRSVRLRHGPSGSGPSSESCPDPGPSSMGLADPRPAILGIAPSATVQAWSGLKAQARSRLRLRYLIKATKVRKLSIRAKQVKYHGNQIKAAQENVMDRKQRFSKHVRKAIQNAADHNGNKSV
jgi:hypothetical protein